MRIWADDLHGWLRASTQEKGPYTGHWDRVIDLVQMNFRDGTLLKECTWKMVVLLPKFNGDFRGVSLIEVLWRTVSGVIRRNIGVAIIYHGVLHEFCTVRGIGTASLEANLIQYLTAMREEVLYEVLLDLSNSCDTLDQEHYLEVIVAYRVGTQTEHLICCYW